MSKGFIVLANFLAGSRPNAIIGEATQQALLGNAIIERNGKISIIAYEST